MIIFELILRQDSNVKIIVSNARQETKTEPRSPIPQHQRRGDQQTNQDKPEEDPATLNKPHSQQTLSNFQFSSSCTDKPKAVLTSYRVEEGMTWLLSTNHTFQTLPNFQFSSPCTDMPKAVLTSYRIVYSS